MKLCKKQPKGAVPLYLTVILLGAALDILTKQLAKAYLRGRDPVVLIRGFLSLNYCENPGIAFGMLADGGLGRILFMTVSSVMILGLSLYLFLGHAENKIYGFSVSLILAGGIGNMIERVYQNYVVDFIDVLLYYPSFGKGGFATYDFPVFNGADSFVCVGAGLLMLLLVIDIVKEARAEKTAGKSE